MNRRDFLKSLAALSTGLLLRRFKLQPESDEVVPECTDDSIDPLEQCEVSLSNKSVWLYDNFGISSAGQVRAHAEELKKEALEDDLAFLHGHDAGSVLGYLSDPIVVRMIASVTDEKPRGGYILPGVDKEYVAKLVAVSQSLARKGKDGKGG